MLPQVKDSKSHKPVNLNRTLVIIYSTLKNMLPPPTMILKVKKKGSLERYNFTEIMDRNKDLDTNNQLVYLSTPLKVKTENTTVIAAENSFVIVYGKTLNNYGTRP